MSSIISVEHITKSYRLGTLGRATFQEDFARWWARLWRRPDPHGLVGQRKHPRQVGDQFWALDDISFEVEQGQAIAIIGRNGAGKSTLLKILSQVVAPTSGQIVLRGRVASLLEVGTGFHPELTGRENVFLNGAILGMTRAEIARKFDEIVDFSEVAQFIDTPVKRYSSGMYIRLAFAVAAHLEPEILIVDEVLAVGDAQFQTKCLGKMSEVSRAGRTVLFVSHNMGAVHRLCQRAVLLEQGTVALMGDTEAAVARYLGSRGSSAARWTRPSDATPGDVCLTEIRVVDQYGRVADAIGSTETPTLVIDFTAHVPIRQAQVSIRVTNSEGVPVFTSTNTDESRQLLPISVGRHRLSVDFPRRFLRPDLYNVGVAIHVPGQTLFDFINKINFAVEDTGTTFGDTRLGVVTPELKWRSELLSPEPDLATISSEPA